jgi:hypothetical protein
MMAQNEKASAVVKLNHCDLDRRTFPTASTIIPGCSIDQFRDAAHEFPAQRIADVCQSHDDCCKECDGDSEAEHRQRDLRPSGNLVDGTDAIRVKEDEALPLNIGYTG